MTARLIMKLRVAEARYTTADVLHVTLAVHPRTPELPAWASGAHVDLRMPDGRVRQYSLCGDPADRTRYDIAIKREVAGRGGSMWAHASLTPGAIAHVSAWPRSNFPLVQGARLHVLVAGGIGVTPFAAMVRKLGGGSGIRAASCARSAAAAPLLADLRTVCGERLRTWFSSEGRRFSAATIGPPDEGSHLYVCGPPRLLDPVLADAATAGWGKRTSTPRFSNRSATRATSPSPSTCSSRRPERFCMCRPIDRCWRFCARTDWRPYRPASSAFAARASAAIATER